MSKLAVISVSDKSNVVEFAKELINQDYKIISTGGTAKVLQENNIDIIYISDFTGFPECLDGRVKTLNPKIYAGILAQRDNAEHMQTLQDLEINTIDLLAVNLYPFKKALENNLSEEDCIENIDIGGPTMIRAAAKNFKDVTVVTNPEDYSQVISRMKNNTLDLEFRKLLAYKVFEHTSHYDTLIASFLKPKDIIFPETLTLTYEKSSSLRYGENPHQSSCFYKKVASNSLSNAKQLHGKELSFNNINDTNAAIELLKEFDEKPTVVAVKHTNPCGVACDDDLLTAYNKAYSSDPVSIFGGIVAINRQVTKEVAQEMAKIFLEVIVAPSFSDEAIEVLTKKKNIRLLELNLDNYSYGYDIKDISGDLLIQEKNNGTSFDNFECVTKTNAKECYDDLVFANKIVKHVKSNAIVLVKNNQTIGIGPGQTNRVIALDIALKYAGDRAENSVLASDAFFPFSDSIEKAAKHKIKAVIQPGGSIKDQDSIDECDKNGITMIFTKKRHFKH